MAPISLIPVTLRSVKHFMAQLGYALEADDGRVLIWRKVSKPPKGLEKLGKNWPIVVSKQYPTFTADGHDGLVYDRSDVTDLTVEITGTTRTDGVRVLAILRSESADPDLPPAHVISLSCGKCGKPTKMDRWKNGLRGISLKCPHCGHEEVRSTDQPTRQI
jgi:hypothetical protein